METRIQMRVLKLTPEISTGSAQVGKGRGMDENNDIYIIIFQTLMDC